ncbi:hypothetical protein PENSPDRAFT_606083 [Peniophora sp. CONT]|nr:hypothetical protein PENSPDRAFT_606083 [Peniophora sp. CONT]
MPLPSFISGLADKAQDALNKSSLGQHIPGSGRPTTPGEGGASSNATLAQLQHQFRSLQIQYGNVTPTQRIVTTEKGVALDFDAVNRDAQAQSKELYMWGKGEDSDLKDVTDRLAFLNYISGQLAGTLATKLNQARTPLKALRDNDATLLPRRQARAQLQTQIDRLEQNKDKGYEKRVVDLRDQLRKAEKDDDGAEKEAEIIKRKAIRESEHLKFEALREYGEKLSLIAQASGPVLDLLPSVPTNAYDGEQKSGEMRAALQASLDNWKPGQVTLMAGAGAMLDRSNTRAFGETHAAEISKINSESPHTGPSRVTASPPPPVHSPAALPEKATATPIAVPGVSASHDQHLSASTLASVPEKSTVASPVVPAPAPISAKSPALTSPVVHASPLGGSISQGSLPGSSTSPPIDPASLNNAPATLPTSATPPAPAAAPNPVEPEVKVPSVTPTVAETGTPIAAKASDPGPASGSLKDLRNASSPPSRPHTDLPPPSSFALPTAVSPQTSGAGGFESAEDEKKRLQREERERLLHGSSAGSSSTSAAPASTGPPGFESAEDEKKRLEREERERMLHGGAPPPAGRKDDEDGAAPPPAYQEF